VRRALIWIAIAALSTACGGPSADVEAPEPGAAAAGGAEAAARPFPTRCADAWAHVEELKERRRWSQTTGLVTTGVGAGAIVGGSSVTVGAAAMPADNSSTTAVAAGVITAGVGVATVGIFFLLEANRAYREQRALERRAHNVCELEAAQKAERDREAAKSATECAPGSGGVGSGGTPSSGGAGSGGTPSSGGRQAGLSKLPAPPGR